MLNKVKKLFSITLRSVAVGNGRVALWCVQEKSLQSTNHGVATAGPQKVAHKGVQNSTGRRASRHHLHQCHVHHGHGWQTQGGSTHVR
jgi:hypothetical protein